MNLAVQQLGRTEISGGMTRPSVRKRLSVLLLSDDSRGHANTVLDHIAGFTQFSSHDVRTFNPRGLTNSRCLDLSEFDVVVIHYSLFVLSDHYLAPAFRDKLRRFQGLKVQFVQDEHRWVHDMTAMMQDLGIHVVFTLLPPTQVLKVYGEDRLPGVVKVHSLAGYVPDRLVGVETPPSDRRPIDIGYRGRTLPVWLGRLSQEKVWIGQGVLERAEKYRLRCDIAWAEVDRIYGKRWEQFLGSCKATLGTESGASITDFDGSIEKRTKDYLAEHPDADFHQVSKALLEPYEGNVCVNVISPRIFEAAALRTALILFPGEYSGIVQPWVHYIPLAKDFSNMDEVVEKLRDAKFLRAMTETAYADLVVSGRYSYQSFVRDFDAVVAKYGRVSRRGRLVRYRLSRVERPLAVAAMNAQQVAEPFWLLPAAFLKGCIALKLLVSTCGGRKILFEYLVNRDYRSSGRLGQLLRDVLKLAIVGKAQTGVRTAHGRFYVLVRFDRDTGQLLFVSRQVTRRDSDGFERPPSTGNEGGPEACWSELESAVREGRLQAIVWNHSELGGRINYNLNNLMPFRGLSVGVGEYDLHRFHALEELAQRFPKQTWDLLASNLRAGHKR